MTPKRIMIIAGEASGDQLAGGLVNVLREKLACSQAMSTTDAQPLQASLEPEFFGAGGPAMKAAGVKLDFDMTSHSVVGLVEVLKNYGEFRRIFAELRQMAIQREPHAIICVDFSGFNRRFGHAVRSYVRSHDGPFLNWKPKLIQYVSPQVWASRESRAYKMAEDFDLLLTIFPFEKDWYANRLPDFPVKFVGHPLVDRYGNFQPDAGIRRERESLVTSSIVLLPGSRAGELARHLPVMREALLGLQSQADLRWKVIVPNDALAEQARGQFAGVCGGEIRSGWLAVALAQ